ncbi:AMP-binding protein [Salicibibacter cibi]|uniref:AMP-binding protein n=1 Tax=Salicibibacter cibi TaxID=2743001 RepID=A0A7T6ZC39_9BACI|nr:AMP-binding protein [Salicibibacter cibi]QQK80306.1 AMP-binding protein [Salicibibacter cibi]
MNKPWYSHWPKGLPKSMDFPELPVHSILKGSAERFSEQIALTYKERDWTFAEIYEQSLRFANALHVSGIRKGDVVSIHMPNCPQYMIAYYGIMMNGAIFSPANPMLTERELSHQLKDCEARAVVTHETAAHTLRNVLPETMIDVVVLTSEKNVETDEWPDDWYRFSALLANYEPESPEVGIDPKQDLAHIAYTGGTTGRSKGVMITHYNAVCNIIQSSCWSSGFLPDVVDDGLIVNPASEMSKGEFPVPVGTGTVLNISPWYHAMGTLGYMNNLILQGTRIVLHTRFQPEDYLDAIEQYGVTTIGGSAPMFSALVNAESINDRDLTSVRQVRSGAAPISTKVLQRLHELFPNAIISEGYGLTEASMMHTSNPGNKSGLRKLGSVGMPVFATDIKIVADDSDDPLPIGYSGEVCAKGPQIMKGYYKKPEETKDVLKDGWLRTGDIGQLDEDGYLYIVDRKKDMLIHKGYNVYPRELEELLMQHSLVANAAVVGIPHEESVEIPIAFVILKSKPDSLDISSTKEQIMADINKQVVPYKKIRDVYIEKELPITGAGKILKRALKEKAQSHR